MSKKKQRILVIRLGALGDLVFCFQAFQDIRAAHPAAEIVLLTRAPFAEFARQMPWFDRVIVDPCPSFVQIGGWLRLRRTIADFAPTRIYDLQGKNRQTILYGLLGGPWGPVWSGAAPLCHFPRPWPPTPSMHFTDFLAGQLRTAGVAQTSKADLNWLSAPMEKFSLPAPYAVLIPGCSPGTDYKKWPAVKYAEMVHKLGMPCIAVGTSADARTIAAIKASAPQLIDLGGQTNVPELAAILRRAACVVGNDTGPLHLAAAIGAPTLALFSGRSNPAWSKPPGPRVAVRQSEVLSDLKVDEVVFACKLLLQHTKNETR